MPALPAQANCPICRTSNYRLRYDLTYAHRKEDVAGWIVQCRNCSMWFKIISDAEQFSKTYTHDGSTRDFSEKYSFSDSARTLFRHTLTPLKSMAKTEKQRLLDIGTGEGTLLEEAQKLGFAAEGIDLRPVVVEAGIKRGLKMRQSSAENLDENNSFDVITMMDLIEHVTDPVHLLNSVHRALKPGGTLVVYTPNHRAAVVLLARLLNFLGLKYPIHEIFGSNHVCFFDDQSLPHALQKTGFSIQEMKLAAYDPRRPGQYVSPLNAIAIAIIEWLGIPFRRVFRMTVYARKTAPINLVLKCDDADNIMTQTSEPV